MKAVRLHRFGGPEALSLDDIDRPQPEAGEALVRVHAASVNPVDFKIRQGHFPAVKAEDLRSSSAGTSPAWSSFAGPE